MSELTRPCRLNIRVFAPLFEMTAAVSVYKRPHALLFTLTLSFEKVSRC